MRSALYYPHTSVDNPTLIKSALLLWDKLECIVPWPDFQEEYATDEIAEAMKIVGVKRYPTEEDKRDAHAHIEEVFTRSLPPQFYYDAERRNRVQDYEIYPQKLLPETWEMLRSLKMAGDILPNDDRPMSQEGGLTVMSILADCCAGATRTRVTDRGSAYATLAGILSATTKDEAKPTSESEDQLVPITLEIIEASSLDLRKLIEFRKKEEGTNGLPYRELRYRYLDGLEKYVQKLTTTKGRASDVEEIKRQFEIDMRLDLENLKSELRSAKREVAFSKDVMVTALAGAGTIASAAFAITVPIVGVFTLAGLPATVSGVLGVSNKYYAARRGIMQKHPMAYMYELARS